jgi:hypothetical protein
VQPRLIGLKALQSYVGLGEKRAAQLGREARAVVRYGTRVLYDREQIDKYIDELREKEASADGINDNL